MNKRDRQQLKESIARDLIQGQGEHSATKELLRQYAPLEGIVSTSRSKDRGRAEPPVPVEKSLAPHATLARNQTSPWHDATVAPPATVAPDATVERLAAVKGELHVPNTINFSLFPTLDPFAKAVYYQLFLLSHGFRRETCVVGLAKLAKSVLMSQRKVQDTITYLEKRGLIRRLRAILGGPSKGNLYHVPFTAADVVPHTPSEGNATVAEHAIAAPYATLAHRATLAPDATNKDDDDNNKKQSSSKGRNTAHLRGPVENHSRAAAPRERHAGDEVAINLVREAYESATGNPWSRSDTEAYEKNGLGEIPAGKIISVMEAVAARTSAKINSFRYFLREIVSLPDQRARGSRRGQFKAIIRRIRENSVGRAGYSSIDFLEDVKCACAREAVPFDDDLFSELAV